MNDWQMLYEAALKVQKPRKLSHLMEAGEVAAAILTKDGNIYVGVCIDTACSMGMCAERNAMANMITHGEQHISKLVAVMGDGSVGAPCGVCREFMMQLAYENRDAEILADIDTLKTVTLKDILPDWWGDKVK
jgi:cytidine deaminase